MGADTKALLREALALSDVERADLAAELLASLDDPSTADPSTLGQLWATEIERRARRVLAGPTDGEDWPELHRRIAAELAEG